MNTTVEKEKQRETEVGLRPSVRFEGLAEVAKRVKCHKFHLSAVLHGRRKANDRLRRELLALGIATTADGERI